MSMKTLIFHVFLITTSCIYTCQYSPTTTGETFIRNKKRTNAPAPKPESLAPSIESIAPAAASHAQTEPQVNSHSPQNTAGDDDFVTAPSAQEMAEEEAALQKKSVKSSTTHAAEASTTSPVITLGQIYPKVIIDVEQQEKPFKTGMFGDGKSSRETSSSYISRILAAGQMKTICNPPRELDPTILELINDASRRNVTGFAATTRTQNAALTAFIKKQLQDLSSFLKAQDQALSNFLVNEHKAQFSNSATAVDQTVAIVDTISGAKGCLSDATIRELLNNLCLVQTEYSATSSHVYHSMTDATEQTNLHMKERMKILLSELNAQREYIRTIRERTHATHPAPAQLEPLSPRSK